MGQAQILIVEDEFMVAEDIRRNLEDRGYTVSAVVSSGEEAIEKAEETRPDLVLMDLMLKGTMTGLQAAEKIRESLGIPVIYETVNVKEIEDGTSTAGYGYILKPITDWDSAIATIEKALGNRETEDGD